MKNFADNENNTFVENQPNAGKLMESMRATGYDNYSAIADLIDNSFDAGAKIVKITISNTREHGGILRISDNGVGMDKDTLKEAMRLGSETDKDEDALGKYGLGLNTASMSIGRRLLIITKQDNVYLTAIQDLDDIERENKFIINIRESTATERQAFNNALGSVNSGTNLVIQKIDNLHNKNTTIFNNKLINKMGMIFRDYIDNGKIIEINDKEVHAIDPMMRDYESVELLSTTKDFDYTDKEGKACKSSIKLKVFRLPNLTQTEQKNITAPETVINQKNQGFYIMRNNRQIDQALDLDMFTRHGSTNRFRAEIYFSSVLDKAMGATFKKESIKQTDEQAIIFDWLRAEITHQIESIKKQGSDENKKTKKLIDHTRATRVIAAKGNVLERPMAAIGTQTAIITGDMGQQKKLPTGVKITVVNNSRLAPLFQVDLEGKYTNISYNADHPFYMDIINGVGEDNKELQQGIDFLIYSISTALLDITATAETIKLKDKFLSTMSNNLRTLLS